MKARPSVDWGALTHAYGSAENIPVLLDQIAEGKRRAVDRLRACIAHQGWLSPEPALHLVPRLFELAKLGACRDSVLLLLADMACAGDHGHVLQAGPGSENASFLLSEPAYLAVRERIQEHAPGVLPWLNDRSATVRSTAAVFLAATQHGREAIEVRLESEKHAAVRFDLLIALGWIHASHYVPASHSITRWLDADCMQSRLGAAIALALAGPLSEDAAELLFSALSPRDLKSAWDGGNIPRLALAALRYRAEVEGRQDLLVRAFQSVDRLERAKLGASLLKSVFEAQVAEIQKTKVRKQLPTPPLSALSDDQRSTLELLAQFDSGWGYSSDQRYWLEKMGFPECPPAMREYFGRPAVETNVLDQLLSYAGRKAPLWQHLQEVCVTDGPDRAIDFAQWLSAEIAPSRCCEFAVLSRRVKVPSTASSISLCLHYLVALGSDAAPHLRRHVDAYSEAPEWRQYDNYWTYGIRGGNSPNSNSRAGDSHITPILFSALSAIAPDTPASLMHQRVRTSSVTFLLGKRDELGERAFDWLNAALRELETVN